MAQEYDAATQTFLTCQTVFRSPNKGDSMLKIKPAAIVVLMILTIAGSSGFKPRAEAASQPVLVTTPPVNKFVGHWLSHLTVAGQTTDEGDIYISDVDPPDANTVNVSHSRYGRTYVGYTFSYPDRIEIQIPLGNGRVAHYNGILVSATRIEGFHIVTSGQSSIGPLLGSDTWTSDTTTP
jgi:hypothetical protein